MGHYRSEMVSEDQEERAAAEKKRRRDATTERIQKEIDERGIASVLAEMIEDQTMFSIRYKEW